MKNAMVIAVLFTVMAGGGLYAQAIPGGFASPQSSATQGRLRSAADDFIRPDSYAGVAFTNWYGMASFASTNLATLGYATKIGGGEEGGKPIYLGVFYYGSFWANITKPTATERENEWLDTTTKRVPVYKSFPALSASATPSNQLAVLIGVADMGFRLSFRTTYQSFKEGEFAVEIPPDPPNPLVDPTYDYYKSHEIQTGLLSPQIAWSMAKNLTANGIKPWATFDLGFNRDYRKTAEYAWFSGIFITQERVFRSQNNIAPELNVGLGSYTFANKNGWRTAADLEYRLQIRAYNDNEYHYIDGNNNYKTKKFNGTFITTGNSVSGYVTTINEESFNGHRVRPIISTQWNGDKLRLRAKLDLNLLFENTEKNPMMVKALTSDGGVTYTDDPSGKLVYNGPTGKAFAFSFNPDLNLGAQWQATSRLFLNIGGRINVAALVATTTKGAEYINGDAVKNGDYITTAASFGGTQNHLNLGVTINATDNVSVEAVTGLSGTSKTTNNVNVFDTGTSGLFNFGSILVALKF